MPTTIESSGKTLDEAIRSGLSALGVEREAVTVEILSKPKTGFFGIGSTLAKVKLTLSTPEKPEKADRYAKSERSERPHERTVRPERPERTETPVRPAPAPTAQAPVQTRPESQTAPQQRPAKPSRPARPAQNEAVQQVQRKRTRPTIPATEENCQKASEFISGLLKHIDMGMSAETRIEDGAIYINLEGENVGNLIGRHGETLDAIQHLVTNAVNLKNDGVTVRVQVDAADYRRKRQEALEQLAHRMAENAKKYNTNMTLEPMNAFERHVIHVALQDVQGIVTFSTGTEPQRRVVISTASRQRREERTARGGDNRNNRTPRSGNTDRNDRNDRNRAPRTDRRDDNRGPREAHGHTNNTRPASQAFRSNTPPPRPQNITPPVQSAPVAPSAPTPPPAPRSLPVKEFGTKKS